jgi:alpha-tubulin suppressor-like RCC1 family protein
MHCGIIRWGHNIAGPPHILPPFKNKQVIAISSGNYHTIFLMESGVYGWGENHSFQLGAHNKEKVYLKETVCV